MDPNNPNPQNDPNYQIFLEYMTNSQNFRNFQFPPNGPNFQFPPHIQFPPNSSTYPNSQNLSFQSLLNPTPYYSNLYRPSSVSIFGSASQNVDHSPITSSGASRNRSPIDFPDFFTQCETEEIVEVTRKYSKLRSSQMR
ncbi:hypothetical protein Dimus_011489 [Dionaea muscipula]